MNLHAQSTDIGRGVDAVEKIKREQEIKESCLDMLAMRLMFLCHTQ